MKSRSEPGIESVRANKFSLEGSVSIENGRKSGVVAGDKIIKICRRVCDKRRTVEIR
jgi:hypothetical protein